MHFCNICENMMHVHLVGDDEKIDGGIDWNLFYYCPHCGDTANVNNQSTSTNTPTSNSIKLVDNLVYSRNYNNQAFEHNIINEYVKYDPTLPTTNIIPCPNTNCISNLSQDNDQYKQRSIAYFRNNKSNLQYVYICHHCNTTWRSANFTN